MPSTLIRPILLAACCVMAAPSFAESLATSASSAASSAASAGSASLRGSSESIQGSSDSSRNDPRVSVVDGEYQVAAVEALADRPGMLRLTMAPLPATAGGRGFQLDLPARALGERQLGAGDIVSANQRPYGIEFARAMNREAFFLVLADDWNRDLETRPLVR